MQPHPTVQNNEFMKIIFCIFSFLFFCNLQAQEEDTLYFDFDENYFKTESNLTQLLYPIDTQGQEESLFFIKVDTISSKFKPSNPASLQDFLKSKLSEKKKVFYDDLVKELRKFAIYLVKKENNCFYYIKVIPSYEAY